MPGTPDLFSFGDTPAGKIDLPDAKMEYIIFLMSTTSRAFTKS